MSELLQYAVEGVVGVSVGYLLAAGYYRLRGEHTDD